MDVDAWVESFIHTMGAIYNDDKVIILSYIMRTLVNICTKNFQNFSLAYLCWGFFKVGQLFILQNIDM